MFRCTPSISGEIVAISDHIIAHPSGALETCITIKSDGKRRYLSAGAFKRLGNK